MAFKIQNSTTPCGAAQPEQIPVAGKQSKPSPAVYDNGTVSAPGTAEGSCTYTGPANTREGVLFRPRGSQSNQCVPRNNVFSKAEAMARARKAQGLMD